MVSSLSAFQVSWVYNYHFIRISSFQQQIEVLHFHDITITPNEDSWMVFITEEENICTDEGFGSEAFAWLNDLRRKQQSEGRFEWKGGWQLLQTVTSFLIRGWSSCLDLLPFMKHLGRSCYTQHGRPLVAALLRGLEPFGVTGLDEIIQSLSAVNSKHETGDE